MKERRKEKKEGRRERREGEREGRREEERRGDRKREREKERERERERERENQQCLPLVLWSLMFQGCQNLAILLHLCNAVPSLENTFSFSFLIAPTLSFPANAAPRTLGSAQPYLF
jgi:hypothetical protein